jgi:hypothetical protein
LRSSFAIALASCGLLLGGCSAKPGLISTGTTSGSDPGVAFKGRVHGGQQPISGAHVYFYAVNTTGYAGPGQVASTSNASISLLGSAANTTKDSNGDYYVTTDSNGNFSISGDYTCQIAFPNTYVLAVGGNPGFGANSAANLMASVGNCTSPGFASTYLVVNEVSTVATAYAISGYMTDPTHVSTTGALLANAGIANAFLTLGNLYTQNTGLSLATTPAGNGAVPQSEIDTLANILAACVNSTGPSSSNCTTLFDNAENSGAAPTDTATAAVNIAHNPGSNIATLFGLQAASTPFQPMLSTAPNDFTIALKYTGGALSSPWGIAVDGSGNVWVANRGAADITELSPLGAVLSGTNGFTGGGLDAPIGIAIDGSGDAWTANYGNSSVSEFNSNGVPQSGSGGFTGGGISSPYGIAIDGNNHVWVGNSATVLSELNSSGSPVSSTGYTGGGVSNPYSIAIDPSNDVWTGNNGNSTLSEFNSSGAPQSGSSGFTGGGLNDPEGVAIDAYGDEWLSNNGNTSVSEFNSSGVAQSASGGITGGGLDGPRAIAIDGLNNVWVANEAGDDLSEFNHFRTAVTGSNGYEGGGLAAPFGMAIDGSGNVWLSNYSGNSVTEFVGLATPVVTPIVANLLIPYGSYAVNRP